MKPTGTNIKSLAWSIHLRGGKTGSESTLPPRYHNDTPQMWAFDIWVACNCSIQHVRWPTIPNLTFQSCFYDINTWLAHFTIQNIWFSPGTILSKACHTTGNLNHLEPCGSNKEISIRKRKLVFVNLSTNYRSIILNFGTSIFYPLTMLSYVLTQYPSYSFIHGCLLFPSSLQSTF